MAFDRAKSTAALMKLMGTKTLNGSTSGVLICDVLDGGDECVGEVVLGFTETHIGWCRKLMVGTLRDVVPISDVTTVVPGTTETDLQMILIGFGKKRPTWGMFPIDQDTVDEFIETFERETSR